jgi:hypothetical protein|eukprot:SAG22_NODE_5421_length_1017_cov_1.093682_1_plen_198_part_00
MVPTTTLHYIYDHSVLTARARRVKCDLLQELAEQLEYGTEGALDEKLGSALDLTHALKENGEYTDAVNLGKQTLATFRKVAQPDDPNLLHTLGMLAHAYASFFDASITTRLSCSLVYVAAAFGRYILLVPALLFHNYFRHVCWGLDLRDSCSGCTRMRLSDTCTLRSTPKHCHYLQNNLRHCGARRCVTRSHPCWST